LRRGDQHPTVLLIEEDPLAGLAVGDALAEAGDRVAGPLTSQAAALAWAAGRAPDLAIRDLPLRGGDGCRLAQVLRARGVRFVAQGGDARDAPRLTKPAWHRGLVLVLDQLAREARP
jgi:DNA-binding response OmpR family regulator